MLPRSISRFTLQVALAALVFCQSVIANAASTRAKPVTIGVLATFPTSPDRLFIQRLQAELVKRDSADEFVFQIHDIPNFESLTADERQNICRSRYKLLVVFSELTLQKLIEHGPCVATVFSLFTRMPQPVRDKFLAPHRTWLTGFDTYIELHKKRLDILRNAYPNVQRIGVLLDKSDSDRGQIRETLLVWGKAGKLVVVPIELVPTDKPINICCRLDAVYVPLSGANWDNRERIMAAVLPLKVPSIVEADAFLDLGATISYQVDRRDAMLRTANQIFLLAKGTSPSSIPVEGVRTVRMTVNVTAAKKISPPISTSIVLAADRTR
ncbi:MAG: ABC transporter substrate binding protein [Burkholderiales bacterium]